MRTASRFLILLTFLFAGFSSSAQEAFPFAAFKADYLKRGTVTISSGGASVAGGRIKMHFVTAPTGERARLKISGNLRLKGTVRPFSAVYIFKPANVAAFSDLAPGIDPDHAATGTYELFPSKITANAPFVFGTTEGEGTLQLRIRKRARGTQLIVAQTLTSNTLTQPIVWRFQALSRTPR